MKGATTCKVCGRDFPLMTEEHYIAQDPEKNGVFARLADTSRNMQYDAFDCPHCGCQNIVQERKPLWMPEECDEQEEESEEETEEVPEHDGCFGCIHVDVPADEEPCCNCIGAKGTKNDLYKKKEDN